MSGCAIAHVLVLVALLPSCHRSAAHTAAADSQPQPELVIYRFPFKAETLYPVTMENIATRGARCAVGEPKSIGDILATLDRADGAVAPNTFKNENVRLLFVRSGVRVAAVEKDGQMQIAGKDRQLPREQKQLLEGLVQASCRAR